MSKFYTNVNRVGNNILIREFDGEHNSKRKVKFQPKFYTAGEGSAYTTLNGEPLTEKVVSSMSDARSYIEQFKDVDGYKLYGNTNFVAQCIAEEYSNDIKFDIDKIRVFNIDIETISLELSGFPSPVEATHPIVTITLYDSFDKKYHVWCFREDFHSDLDDVVTHKCANEKVLLKSFLQYWYNNCPNVVTGWNIDGFDIPFIINRIRNVFSEDEVKFLSPWNRVTSRITHDNFGNDLEVWDIVGVSILDYLTLYKNYTYSSKPSYSLDSIGEYELGAKKLDYSDVGTLKDLYVKDFKRFCDYNVQDVRLVQRIDDKMGLLSLHITLSYYYKQPYNDTFGPVKTWETFIYHYLLKKNILCEVKRSPKPSEPYPGGFVKEPIKGMNSWVVSWDLNSLYPHLIMQFNIGSETLMPSVPAIESQMSGDYEQNINKFLAKEIDTSPILKLNAGVAANGAVFSNEKESFLSSMMKMLYAERKAIKKEMLKKEQELVNAKDSSKEEIARIEKEVSTLNNAQMARKISLNSCYGALGQSSFQFYDVKLASAITTSGQLAIRWIAAKFDAYLNELLGTAKRGSRVLAVDTDSNYLDLSDLVNKHFHNKSVDATTKFVDKFCQSVLQPKINTWYNELRAYMNAKEQRMIMEREAISSRSFWLAKKRYSMLVHNSEGVQYNEPKIKIMGLEIVRSSTPKFCQVVLKKAVKLMLTETEESVQNYLIEVKKKFYELSPEEIAYPRGVNNIQKYKGTSTVHAKGAPKNVKAALMYNALLKTHKMLDEKPITDGDKIKFIDLKLPNHIQYEVIGFPSHLELPKAFDLHQYVDYDIMYQKTFLDPLVAMLHAVGWEDEKKASLESLFG